MPIFMKIDEQLLKFYYNVVMNLIKYWLLSYHLPALQQIFYC